jgi:Fe2+ or Zn2+ uptake regulation protein
MYIEKLHKCIKEKGVNHSHSREAIYTILLKADSFLTVSQIEKELAEAYPKKVSLNTLYRHLSFFSECNLVITIQDSYKRAYYSLAKEQPMIFRICPKCNGVKKISIDTGDLSDCLTGTDFVTLHKKCKKCL